MKHFLLGLFIGMGLFWNSGWANAAPFPAENAEAVLAEAMLRIESSLVRIETVGGLDVIEDMLAATGPTTGVIVSADGEIITSSFNFAMKPTAVLVTLPGSQQRLNAKIIAHDQLKKLTLLKVEASGLTPAEAVPLDQIQVGQWALALGRTYDATKPNVSLGLVSALKRVEGKAIQTDAKVSPVNYGGPLVDLTGRVLGILVPLSPQESSATAGVNWYDSGIGFAIPLQEVQQVLERMRSGEELKPGLMGVSFDATPGMLTEPVIREVRPGSPAAEAGLLKDDRVIQVNGQPIRTVAGVRQVVGNRYAGDDVTVQVQRGEKQESVSLKLVAELQTFRHGYLGVLPRREQGDSFQVKHVLADSVAEKAGLQPGDVILSWNGTAVTSRADLSRMAALEGESAEVELGYRRGENEQTVKITLAAPFSAIPNQIPLPALAPANEQEPARAGGDSEKRLADYALSYDLYIPEQTAADVPLGLMFWLNTGGQGIPADQLAQWKRICRVRGFILAVPKMETGQRWGSDDELALRACVDTIVRENQIDPDLVVLLGLGDQPTFVGQFAMTHRDLFHGLVIDSVPTRIEVPFNEPGHRFRILFWGGENVPPPIRAALGQVAEQRGFSLLFQPRAETLTPDDFDLLSSWAELLGMQ